MENRKTNAKTLRKRALLSSVVMLLIAAIALSTATYAWFSSSTKATVATINLEVAAASGVQISATGGNGTWRTLLPLEELFAAGRSGTNLWITDKAVPVSTSLTPTESAGARSLVFYDGVINDDNTLTSTPSASTGAEGKYVAFDVYAKVSADTSLYLIGGTGVTNRNAAIPLSYASRIAIIDNGAVVNEAAVADWGSNLIANSSPDTVWAWEPDSTTHIADAVLNPAWILSGTAPTAKYSYVGFNGVFANQTEESINTTPAYGTTVSTTKTPNTFPTEVALAGDVDAYSDCKVAELSAGINKLRVYIWIEGQDADCLNPVSGTIIDINLIFGIVPPTVEQP